MAETTIVASNWRSVEVGRIVLIQGEGASAGRLAAIVEIIDHKRVCSNSKWHEESWSGLELTSVLGSG